MLGNCSLRLRSGYSQMGFSDMGVSNDITQHVICKSSQKGELFPPGILVSLYGSTDSRCSMVFLHPPKYLSNMSGVATK